MGSSRKVREDDEYIYLTKYMHDESDEYPAWMVGPNGECPDPAIPQHIVEADTYATYEVQLTYRIRKSDGKVIYDGVK